VPDSSFFSPSKISQKVDNYLTNYLRNTTTDQEILNFYGEGNIIGRKGISKNPSDLLEQSIKGVQDAKEVRPRIKTDTGSFGMFGDTKETSAVVDIPNAISNESKRPWQLKTARLAFPTSGGVTPAASQFLSDFRVPIGNTTDYAFEISPNVQDVKEKTINGILNNPSSYKDSGAAYKAMDAGKPTSQWGEMWNDAKENVNKYNNIQSGIIRFDGEITTPERWKKEGYTPPQGLKEQVLDTFRQQVLSSENPFGSVSHLTPIREPEETVRPGGSPDWRANLYEKQGFAGPLTDVSVKTPYGPMTDNVQMFVRGNERLLPIQPYSEFRGDSKPSAVGGEPASDFTPFQKRVGTRNYLIGKNILEGRGSLGTPVRVARGVTSSLGNSAAGFGVGAAVSAMDPAVVADLERGKYKNAAGKVAGNTATGTLLDAGLSALVPAAAPVLRFAGPVATGAALFGQGSSGSLTNFAARKAAQHPISWLPSVQANPKTDIGARSSRAVGNEFRYASQAIKQGLVPYLNLPAPWARR